MHRPRRLLAELPLGTLGELIAAGGALTGHVEGCELCADRQRAMASVRSLVAQAPVPDTPPEVRDGARRSRRMRPAAAPPPLEPTRGRPTALIALGAMGLVAVVGAVAVVVVHNASHDDRAARVSRLARVPKGRGLRLVRAGDGFELSNATGRPARFTAMSDAPWLVVRPAEGQLETGQTTRLSARVTPSSPEGNVSATVTVSSDDGSAAAATYAATVNHPPDVSADRHNCSVTATVADDDGVASVELHWSDGDEHVLAMSASNNAYTADLPESTPLSWWVDARDTAGNVARTPRADATC